MRATGRALGLVLLWAACVGSARPASAVLDDRVDRLSERHRDWLEKEVVYIISDTEREVFLSLESVDERDRFIEAFWRKRDPSPATPINEFKVEHYRRFEYANTYLGRDTFREGWRTDRGRFYIMLGEPQDIQRYDGYAEVNAAHLWFYRGDPRLGTPAFFYLLFFQRADFGEFRLYNPIIDGPNALLKGTNTAGPLSDNRDAVRRLREVSAELAIASLTFDTSEPVDLSGGRPAIGSDMMIARIEAAAKRTARTDYADAWLRYGRRVSSDYSFNFVPSRNMFCLLSDASGTSLVHFSIELDPENFSVETDEAKTKFYTTLDLTIEARTKEGGELVVSTDKEAYIEMSASQMAELGSRPVAYQDDFPLIPGDYTVSVILRNRVLQQYTVAERELSVPEIDPAKPALTDVVLAFESETRGGVADPDRVATFQVGATRFQPATGGLFIIGDTVHVIAQAVGATPEHRVHFFLRDGDRVLKEADQPMAAGSLAVDYLKLDDLVGGSYEVVARLSSPAGEVLSEKTAPLVVSPRSAIPRPGYVYRRGVNTSIPGLMDFMVGDQYWSLGNVGEAVEALEKAVATGNPRLVPARWTLANAYLRQERADEALELLNPLEAQFTEQYEVVAGLGFAHYLRDEFDRAVGYLSRARTLKAPDTFLLNALGDCHQRLGNVEDAREAFSRSLELNPDQPTVRERLELLSGGAGSH